MTADEHQRGGLMEERVLKGDLAYESSMPRFAGDEERFVLLAMHQTLVERGRTGGVFRFGGRDGGGGGRRLSGNANGVPIIQPGVARSGGLPWVTVRKRFQP